MHAIHASTIDTLSVIVEDMKRKMIRHISSKLGVSEEEMIQAYCNDPVNLQVCNTIQIQGIAIQEGPVFLEPPKPPSSQSTKTGKTGKTGTKVKERVKTKEYTNEELKDLLGEEPTNMILSHIEKIQDETDRLVSEIGDRMIDNELFERKETRVILKRLNMILNEVVKSGIITKTQVSNRMNRNITNVLHGADPSKDKTLRKIARENPKKFFDILVHRVKNVMIQNMSRE